MDVAFDGRELRGELLNAPGSLRSVSEGDRLAVPLERLSDWMYEMDAVVYGAFTVHELRSRMSASERRAHDEAAGVEFGDPAQPHVVPFGVGGPDDEHPLGEKMAPGLREHLAADPGALERQDEDGLRLLHHLALGGSEACARVALELGADVGARTRRGLTARDLAATLGWPRVLALLPDG